MLLITLDRCMGDHQTDQKGKAYVCDLTADEIRQYRGTLTEPGKEARTVTVLLKKSPAF